MQTQNNKTPEQKREPSTVLKIVVLIGLIVLLIIGILLPIKLVPNAVSSFKNTLSSLFGTNQTVDLTADRTTINSGEPFTLSWTGKHRDNGSYVLSYQCKDGVRIETSISIPNETITCNSLYYFSVNDNRIDLTAFSEVQRYTDISFTLAFLENNTSDVIDLDSVLVTVTNPNIADSRTGGTPIDMPSGEQPVTPPASTPEPTPAPVTPKPTPTPTPKPTPTKPAVTPAYIQSNPNGTADLAITINAVGYLHPTTSAFVPSYSVSAGMRPAVKFTVKNNGDKNSGTWAFTANLPTPKNSVYNAYGQQNLGPQDRIEYVLGFEPINNAQNNTVTITVDPQNLIAETNNNNNVATTNIVNNGGTVGGNYGTQADLIVRIVSTGIVDKNTNQFYATNNVGYNDRAAIKFEIENVGGTASGQYRFQAYLPTNDSNSLYTSGYQPSLNPGQKTIFTVGFDNIRSQGNNPVSVTVDYNNEVAETNNNNNTTSTTIYRY